ncbi:MAG TPA: dihydrolipoamide acetyltransferase family protein [Alphaproteobacteria bacterium]|nr:dihydrolipoamide acetyltransferase family protein [Alphaproteobacteria bacterium]
MARDFKLPDIGEGISEVELLQWYVQEGDVVREDQNLAEIETDKAVADLPSPYAGRISRLHFKAGDRIPVGAVLVSFAEADEEVPQTRAPTVEERTAVSERQRAEALRGPQAREEEAQQAVAESPERARAEKPKPQAERVLATPATRRRARELGIDLTAVEGTGPGGRITPEDLERLARDGRRAAAAAEAPPAEAAIAAEQAPPPTPAQPIPERAPLPDFSKWGSVERVALSATRRQIARRMAQSLYTAPHAAALEEADVTELEAFRQQMRQRLKERNVRLTLLPFVMKAAVAALKACPHVNASLDEAHQELVLKRYYHLGIAVDTERGLIVPVVRDVDRKSIVELATELEDLVQRTRDGKVTLDELRGGTFTLTNAGAVGGHAFIPIINYPEAAILGIGRTQQKPVVRQGQVVVRTILPLSLSFDHRIIDGADAVRFLMVIIRLLEDPSQLLLEA